MFRATHMPCTKCGQSVFRPEMNKHVCDPDKKVNYEVFQLRGELDHIETEITDYLTTPQGLFALYIAEKERP